MFVGLSSPLTIDYIDISTINLLISTNYTHSSTLQINWTYAATTVRVRGIFRAKGPHLGRFHMATGGGAPVCER